MNKKQKKNAKYNAKLQQKMDIQDQNKVLAKNQLLNMSVAAQQQLINDITLKVQQDPQKNIRHLSTLFNLMKSNTIVISNLALDSLTSVFCSITTLQPINISQHEDKLKQTIKREQHELITYELNLVKFYKKYIDELKLLNRSIKKQNFSSYQQYKEYKDILIGSVCKCFSNLWNFNYSKELVDVMGKNIKNQKVLEVFQEFLADRNPNLLHIKIAIIKCIADNIVNKNQSRLPTSLIKILNVVHINTKYLKKDEEAKKYKQKKQKRRHYRQLEEEKKKQKQKDPLQRKRQRKQMKRLQKSKAKEEVKKQFAEGEYKQNAKLLIKQNSEILQEIFYIYFKILVRRTYSVFLKDTLNGILKFTHLISTDLIASLIQNLYLSAEAFRDLWLKTKQIRFIEARLHITFSAESIINGPASVFNMDDIKQLTSYFKILRDINKQKKIQLTKQVFKMLIMVYQEMILKKRQFSAQTVASFIRQILLLLQNHLFPRHSLLQIIRLTVNKYTKLGRMFQLDNEGYGLNSHNEHIEDPRSTNAIYTSVLEILDNICNKHAKKLSVNEIQLLEKLKKGSFQSEKIINLADLIKKQAQTLA